MFIIGILTMGIVALSISNILTLTIPRIYVEQPETSENVTFEVSSFILFGNYTPLWVAGFFITISPSNDTTNYNLTVLYNITFDPDTLTMDQLYRYDEYNINGEYNNDSANAALVQDPLYPSVFAFCVISILCEGVNTTHTVGTVLVAGEEP
jgi:hypothetical protein